MKITDIHIYDLIDIHINGQLELYASNIIQKDNYNMKAYQMDIE